MSSEPTHYVCVELPVYRSTAWEKLEFVATTLSLLP